MDGVTRGGSPPGRLSDTTGLITVGSRRLHIGSQAYS